MKKRDRRPRFGHVYSFDLLRSRSCRRIVKEPTETNDVTSLFVSASDGVVVIGRAKVERADSDFENLHRDDFAYPDITGSDITEHETEEVVAAVEGEEDYCIPEKPSCLIYSGFGERLISNR